MIPDQLQRDRIENDFELNMMVDASAGSGKTESLSRRMANGILQGHYRVERMAAVTFTRKAASELRSRLQEALERAASKPEHRARALEALANLETMFVGTIHSFCSRLLREFPVEAGISPGFRELDEAAQKQLLAQVFARVLETCPQHSPGLLEELSDSHVRPVDLLETLAKVCNNSEVDYPAPTQPRPDPAPLWQALDAFANRLREMLPEVPRESTCKLQKRASTFLRRIGYSDRETMFGLVECLELWQGDLKVVQKYWPGTPAERKALSQDALDLARAFVEHTVEPFFASWRAYLYGLCMLLMLKVRQELVEERRRTAQLDFSDLLQLAAGLLRRNRRVRLALQQKFSWLFVDEFQDTDPIQAEVVTWLASQPDFAGEAWTEAPLRAGCLFVVGDPKQSIYRFRRADIDTYNLVKQHIASQSGAVLSLTTSFRSLPALCSWTNQAFQQLLPAQAGDGQAAFSGLEPVRQVDDQLTGVFQLTDSTAKYNQVAENEAHRLAGLIVEAVRKGGYRWGDFMILTARKAEVSHYAHALEQLRVPVEATGGSPEESPWLVAVKELLCVLGDPQDQITTVGVLRGLLYGLSDEELFRHRQEGGSFTLLTAPYGRGFGPVLGALADLHQMHGWTRQLPAGAAIEKILEQTGVLAMAATTNPGEGDVPALLQLADQIRLAHMSGRSLAQAMRELDLQKPPRPISMNTGRREVVRVMNLHQAKGLQAAVVFLAAPTSGPPDTASQRVVREGGQALGYLTIGNRFRTFAQPLDWPEHERIEREYLAQERIRLLYVATTRARDLLVISRWNGSHASAKQPWARLHGFLEQAEELPWQPLQVAPEPPEVSLEAANQAFLERSAAWATCRQPTWSRQAVTAVAAGEKLRPVSVEVPAEVVEERQDAGPAWGELIHRLLEQAMRGCRDRESLERLAHWYAFDQPELASVVGLAVDTVLGVMQTEFWSRVLASGRALTEVPFGVRVDDGLLFGVLDLALHQGEGWELVDYKTDQKGLDELVARYAGQVEEYARHWATLVEPVTYAGLFGVRQGELSSDVRE